MRKLLIALTCAATMGLAGCAAGTVGNAAPAAATVAPAADPVQELLSEVEIPYETFTLDNGLRVIVHEDRKAPVIAVSVWYNVGSKDEPEGRTGFAHLFEHMMFYGSENAPGNYFQRMEQIGATDLNGTTWFDRTNYFETVPSAAIETALFLESDRMGHLLGAVTEEKLRNQVGVVQNEKRQSDNQPFGLVFYRQLDALFPDGHPYSHSPIGSMEDLSAASLADVHEWFRSRYGPNNAVLVLAGDISAAEARPLVERYFGDIPRGPENRPAEASIPTLPARVDDSLSDRVATTRLYRTWVVPGIGHEDLPALKVAASVLGGLASSRLDNQLVRQEQTAVRVSTGLQDLHRVGLFEVQVDVKPGVDADAVAQRLDQLIADFVANGPTADEVNRVVMQTTASRVRGLEQVGGFGGKAVALAEGALYMDDPSHFRRYLADLADTTPAEVRAAMQLWLTRPVYALRVSPGPRPENLGAVVGAPSAGTPHALFFRAPEAGDQPLAPMPLSFAQVDRSRVPEPGPISDLQFPEIERATLSNGIPVVFARRSTVPVVRISMQFDAGFAADPEGREGLQSLMASLLDEGTATRNSTEIAEQQERLGAVLSTGAGLDRTSVGTAALRTNLPQSLDLLADVVKNPAFAPSEIERVRAQRLAGIASELTQPIGIALRTLPPLLYGGDHPYGVPLTGSGTPEAVQAITRDDIVAAHQRWIRPETAEIFAVGDITLAELLPMLEARFGNWQAPPVPAGRKDFSRPVPSTQQRVVLVDRPQSPQSMILAGAVMPVQGTDDLVALEAANEALGSSPAARLNMDLRETKGWAYGAFSFVNRVEHEVPLIVFAPVQTDRTGESMQALIEQINAFVGPRGVTPEELQRIVNNNIRGLPGSYETSQAVLSALASNSLYDRPDDYQSTLASRYRALTTEELNRAARQAIHPNQLVWVVVGDAALVRPQLEELGIPVEIGSLR